MKPLESYEYRREAAGVLYLGDVLEVLSSMDSESVQCCITSPPYWDLRDYGTGTWEGGDPECKHTSARPPNPESKQATNASGEGSRDSFAGACACRKCGARRIDNQLGLEKSPEEYVQKMVAVFREVRRVLKKDGTCWLNLGDSYNSGTNPPNEDKISRSTLGGGKTTQANSRRACDSSLKPKDLVGIPWRVAFALQADGWWLRQDIIWAKGSPMPESVRDRCTKAHEYIFMLTKAARYYYDADAIKEPATESTLKRGSYGWNGISIIDEDGVERRAQPDPTDRMGERWCSVMRNKRSVWNVNTQGYKGAHFATFPPKLIQPMILAGSRSGDIVLDCFCGSGTVPMQAKEYRRQYIGIDLKAEYLDMAIKRIGQEEVLPL